MAVSPIESNTGPLDFLPTRAGGSDQANVAESRSTTPAPKDRTPDEPSVGGSSPTSSADPVYRGWWRYPPAAWLGLVTVPAGIAVLSLGQVVNGFILHQLVLFVGITLLTPSALALVLGSVLSFGTVFWGSKRYETDESVDWQPRPVIYLAAAVVFSPLVIGGVWFVQRVRHVGLPDFSTWI